MASKNKPKHDDEPPVWLTVIKLVVIATVLIGGTGLLLSYVAEKQGSPEIPKPQNDWGILSDSPIHSKR